MSTSGGPQPAAAATPAPGRADRAARVLALLVIVPGILAFGFSHGGRGPGFDRIVAWVAGRTETIPAVDLPPLPGEVAASKTVEIVLNGERVMVVKGITRSSPVEVIDHFTRIFRSGNFLTARAAGMAPGPERSLLEWVAERSPPIARVRTRHFGMVATRDSRQRALGVVAYARDRKPGAGTVYFLQISDPRPRGRARSPYRKGTPYHLPDPPGLARNYALERIDGGLGRILCYDGHGSLRGAVRFYEVAMKELGWERDRFAGDMLGRFSKKTALAFKRRGQLVYVFVGLRKHRIAVALLQIVDPEKAVRTAPEDHFTPRRLETR